MEGSSFARNAGTLGAGLIFGRIYNNPILVVPFVQPNHFLGGSFDVNFRGIVTIK